MRVAVLVAIALGVTACDRGDAIEYDEWLLRYDGHEAYVELPRDLSLPDRDLAWTLDVVLTRCAGAISISRRSGAVA